MCDDVSSDGEKEETGKKSTTSLEPEKCAVQEKETHTELSKQTEITRSWDDNNLKTFKGIIKNRHKKSLKFPKKEVISKNTGNSNTKLQLRQSGKDSPNKNGNYENIITRVKDAERNVCENSVTFSFQAEGKNGVSLPSDATNTVGSTRYSDKRGRVKVQRKNERKSSRLNVTPLPPLEEEKSVRSSCTSPSVSPNIRRHTIGYHGEKEEILLPSIVVSKSEEVSWGEKTLKLPRIEVANSKGRYPRRLSLPNPNRLAPPIFQESSKAHRPPVLPSTEDSGDCTRNAIRLPQLRPGSSVISGSYENGNQK